MKVYTTNKNVAAHYSDEEKYQRLLDAVPRTALPTFLAEFHERRRIQTIVEARKAERRERYKRRYLNRAKRRLGYL
jgi:hypothetical protein